MVVKLPRRDHRGHKNVPTLQTDRAIIARRVADDELHCGTSRIEKNKGDVCPFSEQRMMSSEYINLCVPEDEIIVGVTQPANWDPMTRKLCLSSPCFC